MLIHGLGISQIDSLENQKDTLQTQKPDRFLGLEIVDDISKDTVRNFTLDDISESSSFQDTSLQYFEDYDLLKPYQNFYLTLGNPGSSHKEASIQLHDDNIFTQTHTDSYSALRSNRSDFRYYVLNRPFNDLYFSPMGSQQNFMVKAKFSRDFKESINVSLDYWRIANTGDYTNQETKATSFNIGLWIKNPKKSHQTFLTLLVNNFNEEYNGGAVEVDSLSNNSQFNNIRIGTDVFLNNANGRNQEYQIILENYLGDLSSWNLYHRFQYNNFFYRYSDDAINANSTEFYRDFLTDDRGIRVSHEHDKITNQLSLSKSAKNIDFAVGASHQYLRYQMDAFNQKLNDASIEGKLRAGWDVFSLHSLARIGLLDSESNLFFKAWIDFNLKKTLKLNAGIQLKNFNPNLLDQYLDVSQVPVWRNEFDKTFTSSIFGELESVRTNSIFSIAGIVLEDGIFYDQNANPQQENSSISYIRFTGQQKLNYKWLHSDHIGHVQIFSENLYNLPSYIMRHKLFVQVPLFKRNLITKLGGTYSFASTVGGGNAFLPLTQSFYNTDSLLPNYHNLDAFLTLQIQNFRAFLIAENITFLLNDRVNLLVENVPQWDFKLRFGVRWIIFD